jgi:hypothetical protein
MLRSPEARLAGWWVDADKTVRPFLDNAAEEFFISVQKQWEWNSRYWEQRALLVGDGDLDIAISYARCAVAIEKHPFPLTTLSKLLLRQMERSKTERKSSFDEALMKLCDAIESAAQRSRISVHPFSVMIAGTARYLELGGVISSTQTELITSYAVEAKSLFGGNSVIVSALRRLGNQIRLP